MLTAGLLRRGRAGKSECIGGACMLKTFLAQLGGTCGAAVAAACCLGVPVVLSAFGALGLGFLINDALLLPLFPAFVGLTLWLLYRSVRRRGVLAPFWLGLAGGVVGIAGLVLQFTPIGSPVWLVPGGVLVLLAASVWDFANSQRGQCAH